MYCIRFVDSYKKGQISVLDYLNAIAANIEVTQYIDGDFVIDYNEEAAIMIEDQMSLCQKLRMLVNYQRKQVYVNYE
jgi:hypothetical protein